MPGEPAISLKVANDWLNLNGYAVAVVTEIR